MEQPSLQLLHRTARIIAWLCLCAPLSVGAQSPAPWRFASLTQQSVLRVSGHLRLREEHIARPFRNNFRGSDALTLLRSDVLLELPAGRHGLVAEFMDSRQSGADQSTFITTGMVNTAEVIQAHAMISTEGLPGAAGRGSLRIGRQTIDLGSRRLVSNALFRNTTNTFTGLRGSWDSGSTALDLVYVRPGLRLPQDRAALLDNTRRHDEEPAATHLAGLLLQSSTLLPGHSAEGYLMHLDEEDSAEQATLDRDLVTAGLRVLRQPSPGNFDAEVEAYVQTGTSRNSLVSTTTLQHEAYFLHAQAGYSFPVAWKPRLLLQFDYASGDRSPDDLRNNRFDTLYGAHRFDFGPTSIMTVATRTNLVTPGYRLFLQPRPGLNFMWAHRYLGLASARDAWTSTGQRDSSGDAGRHLGQLVEASLTWQLLPGNLSVETGAAVLLGGSFMSRLTPGAGSGETRYAYLQTTFTF